MDSYFEEVFANLSGFVDDGNKPGFSVIITKKYTILYQGNFGSGKVNEKSPISETTIFDVASLSKQFTGMAIALLKEKGEIAMNDHITTYLPDLPEVMSDITIYQLVHHSSGIRDWPALFVMKGWQPEDSLSMDDIYHILKNKKVFIKESKRNDQLKLLKTASTSEIAIMININHKKLLLRYLCLV